MKMETIGHGKKFCSEFHKNNQSLTRFPIFFYVTSFLTMKEADFKS